MEPTPPSFFDYIVVGSGPGGATVARYLSDDPKIKVLLLEAGENHDNDEVIANSADAWIGAWCRWWTRFPASAACHWASAQILRCADSFHDPMAIIIAQCRWSTCPSISGRC